MKYLFVLGNNPSLSVVELLNKLQPKKYFLISKDVFLMEFNEKIDELKVIKKIGGTIKIVELLEREEQDLPNLIKPYLPEDFEGKYKFGLSFYGGGFLETKKVAMDVKRELKSRNISCRWVTGKGRSLSSVAVKKNKLIENKSEFVIVENDPNRYFGITRAVQDFEELSFRDYKRPARDSYSGMIPPKLAQIMLNIGLRGKTDITLLDPFCGSGTVLMEACLMGVRKVLGTDLSSKAIRDSRINLEWSKEKFKTKEGSLEIRELDARKLSTVFKKESIDVIVSEPYLGPQRKVENINKSKKKLEYLYSETVREFRKILKKDGRVVMIWPVIRKAEDTFMSVNIEGFKIVDQIPGDLGLEKTKTKRKTIVYGRKGQRVWREIVVLERA